MAAAVAAVAGSLVSSTVAGAVLGSTVFGATIGALGAQVIGGVAGFAASSLIGGALGGASPAPPTTSAGFTSQAQSRTQVVRSAVANRQVVYGRAMVSGPLVFAASSNDNNTLHLVIALAGHEVDAIESVWFNDEDVGTIDGSGNVTTGRYAGKAVIKRYLGTADQTADPDLIAANVGWTADHRGRGVAYLYVRLTWDRDVFPRGIPNIKAVVRGKKVYDPRTGLTAWSDNWALCVRDYLASAYGLAAGSTELDDTILIAAANVADESVTLAGGGTESRYTCNAVIDTGTTPRQILETLLTGGGGVLVWTAGVYRLFAAVYDSPAATLNEDDLRGAIRVRPRTRRQDLYNAVRGTYVSADNLYQPTDYPVVTNATYAAQDGGETIWRDLALPVTRSAATSQRLAKIALERARQGITVEMPCKLTAFKVAVWDTVQLTIAHLGWSAKVFRVVEWKWSDAGGVDLVLQEEAAAAYDWNSGEETVIDAAPDTALPDPWTVMAPGTPAVTEALYETTGSAGAKAKATVSWAASDDAFVIGYEPAYRLAGAASWTALPMVNALSVDLFDIAPGSYEFRVRALNAIGARSGWSGTRAQEIRGLTAAPATPTGFYLVASDGGYEAEWALATDLDVRLGGRAVIRHSTLTSGATWNDGIVVKDAAGGETSARVPLMAGTYLLKFQDSSGNWSAAPATFVPSEALLTGYTTVATSTQHAGFAGAKSNVAVLGGALRLDSASTVGSMTTPVSEWPKLSSLGGISGSGSYAFDGTLDLGSVAARRFDATITAQSFDTGDLISFRGPVSGWDSVSGDVINDCDATLFIRTTDDDPAGSPTWGPWTPFFVGDFACRAAQFRLDLASGSPTHNLAVSALSVRARIPA